jgi:hypothetical protein
MLLSEKVSENALGNGSLIAEHLNVGIAERIFGCSILVYNLCVCVCVRCFLLAAVWLLFCLPKDFDQKIVRRKSKNWTPSVQDAEPQCGFYVIKLHDLNTCFSAVPVGQRKKLWHEFFLDPS